MTESHPEIFEEPEPDVDTLTNLGPLRAMAGVFEGDRGLDDHPVAGGGERSRYIERYELEPLDPQTNGPQLLYGLRYHIWIREEGGRGTFHDQVGYWLWEPEAERVTHTIAIPRAQVAMASGAASADARSFTLTAERGSTVYGICSSPLLEERFTTTSFTVTVTVHDDDTWSYREDTVLQVLGRDEPFHHTDENTLRRVGEPTANPLMS